MSVRVKICGITRLRDALLACEFGADALGLNFWPGSKRYISPARAARIIKALPPFVQAVGLFVNAPRGQVRATVRLTGVGAVQLHGDEEPEDCAGFGVPVLKAIRMSSRGSAGKLERFSEVQGFVLDAATPGYGGSGVSFDWRWATDVAASHRVVLAGGLTPRNVAGAVKRVRPWAVDVASGVEAAPGKKDPTLMRRFIRAAKEQR